MAVISSNFGKYTRLLRYGINNGRN